MMLLLLLLLLLLRRTCLLSVYAMWRPGQRRYRTVDQHHRGAAARGMLGAPCTAPSAEMHPRVVVLGAVE